MFWFLEKKLLSQSWQNKYFLGSQDLLDELKVRLILCQIQFIFMEICILSSIVHIHIRQQMSLRKWKKNEKKAEPALA